MNVLWRVTFSTPLGRKVSHHTYAVLAATAEEAKAKAIAYVYPNPVEPATYTTEVERDEDGVISGTTHYTKAIYR